MSIFKKEMSAREKFINGAKNVESTASAAMVEDAEINAEYQAQRNSNDLYESSVQKPLQITV